MQSSNSKASLVSIAVIELVFFCLKLFGFVTWDWVWVFSPLWILLVIACTYGIVSSFMSGDE